MGINMFNETVKTLRGIAVLFVILCIIAGIYMAGYKAGQIDASYGIMKYKKVTSVSEDWEVIDE